MSYRRGYKRRSLKKLRQRVAKTDDGLVPLTDRVINELVKRGWDRFELLRYRDSGYLYHPELGTIWSDWVPSS